MNRWDEIKSVALDVAGHVTQDPVKREVVAGDLIRLIDLMVGTGPQDSGCPGCSRETYDGHSDDCNATCPECNRIMRFGHLFCRLDPTRPNGEGAIARVSRCPECLRAEGDGHERSCRLANTVAVHLPHDLDVNARGNCFHCGATPDGPACDWDMSCPVHGDTFGR